MIGSPDPDGTPALRDYVEWHRVYDDPDSGLSKRLRRVQSEVGAFLDRTSGPVRLISSCSGDGRDVLDVLRERSDRDRLRGAFLEINPHLAASARDRIDDLGLSDQLRAVETGAGQAASYAPFVPADLVLLMGIMGNISPADIQELIETARAFCAPGATVIWSRDMKQPDYGAEILGWFADAGFEQVALHENIDGSTTRVGVHRYLGEPVDLGPDRRIFTFFR
jgi:hypothetical protein